MSFLDSALRIGTFLLDHADIVEDIVDVIASGASKDSIRKAIRALKVQVSDAAVKEELGLE